MTGIKNIDKVEAAKAGAAALNTLDAINARRCA